MLRNEKEYDISSYDGQITHDKHNAIKIYHRKEEEKKMKRILVMILTGVMLVAAVGCGSKSGNQTNDNAAVEENVTEDNTAVEEENAEAGDTTVDNAEAEDTAVEDTTTEENTEAGDTTVDNAEAENSAATGAVAILENVWTSYGDAEKFPIGGGDSSNMTMDVPGAFDATNTEELDVTLGFPAAQAGLIDDAASMMHMMNANNFTCGVYHVTDAANAATLADAIKENIGARQWMCGMPEKLLIATVDGEYVLAAFGLNDVMDGFKEKLTTAYAGTTVVYEEAIVE